MMMSDEKERTKMLDIQIIFVVFETLLLLSNGCDIKFGFTKAKSNTYLFRLFSMSKKILIISDQQQQPNFSH